MAKMGRKSTYKKVYCNKIVELAEQGKAPQQWANALGLKFETMRSWAQHTDPARVKPEFKDAWRDAMSVLLGERLNSLEDGTRDLPTTKYLLNIQHHIAEMQRSESKVSMHGDIDVRAEVKKVRTFATRHDDEPKDDE